MKAMNEKEFIAYAHEVLDGEAMEPLYDTISEHNSEVAAFGDSWPGAMIRIHESIAFVNKVERQLARIEKRPVRNFGFVVRSPR